ncbi:hypothetical protein WICMUC_001979 [Wickerhamomyces mucosus]|uniref:K Homology domain-containing protein n=1 Tax=Wickerhamomyces mucosus TaxID=1378264 RepID=A0A9P8PQN7_9ASCO|nr:hypothetical protein WICMUC_001979 [Wickerhamomyces mucosus]
MLKRKNEEDINPESLNSSAIKRAALDVELIDSIEDDPLESADSKISSHKVNSGTTSNNNINNSHNHDPTYTHFRMLCQVKEAALIVGKGGETINHIKEVSQVRINVSENIRGIQERVIHVRGSAENVAKAFGLITRSITDEEENKPSDINSKPINIILLIPHQMIGYVIGKQGSKFKEIQEKSAAQLSASSHSMPLSTDRCLTISGVADAIHIATYYVALTLIEKKDFAKGKVIFYNPGNQQQQPQPQSHNNNNSSNQQQQQQQIFPFNSFQPNQISNNFIGQFGTTHPQFQNPLLYMNYNSPFQQFPTGQFQPRNFNPLHNNHNNHRHHNQNKVNNNKNLKQQSLGSNIQSSQQQQQQPISLISNGITSITPTNQITQEIFVPNGYVGNIIGKSGKSIKSIKETSGSKIIIEEPNNQKERKITIIGSSAGNQTAVFLINNKIETDKKNNEAKAAAAHANASSGSLTGNVTTTATDADSSTTNSQSAVTGSGTPPSTDLLEE